MLIILNTLNILIFYLKKLIKLEKRRMINMTQYLYKLTINNGNAHLGNAVKYFSYKFLDHKNKSSIVGRLWKSEAHNEDNYEHMISFGNNYITHQNNKYLIKLEKSCIAQETLLMNHVFPQEITIYLLQTEKYDCFTDSKEDIEKNSMNFKKIVDDFIEESKVYYDINISEIEDKKGEIGIYIFDDYWELLNRHLPRPIETIHLDGIEFEILEYLRKFKNPETKNRYKMLGIPYKKNIMFEGPPGTGKTSLLFSLASELDCNLAIINFGKNMDDNNFMRAIRRLPKKCILVLDDIDALFKERKSNDGLKSSLSFSALLNTLDGLAYRQGLITIMTTNFICNLDSALKRPGRIDKIINFKLASQEQTRYMFEKFFPDHKSDFGKFYQKIKYCKFTTAILQQYFVWYMEDYEKVDEKIEEFKKLCEKHNYDNPHQLYS